MLPYEKIIHNYIFRACGHSDYSNGFQVKLQIARSRKKRLPIYPLRSLLFKPVISIWLCDQCVFCFSSVDYIAKGQIKNLDDVIFDLFDLTCTQQLSVQDMSNMLLNLPLEALIVDCRNLKGIGAAEGTGSTDMFKIMKAPDNTDGIRRKRKLLTNVQGK